MGLELNPRAAAIAELVVWIGYLQQHYRTRTGHPGEPILKAFANVNFGTGRPYDAVLTWDGFPNPRVERRDGKSVETFPNARRPDWPDAEFIVGNPPFIGGKDLRSRMRPGYAEALWRAHPQINESADFVMYWWDRASEELATEDSTLRRVGLVTTNSISQLFQRRVMERSLDAVLQVSLIFAVPDHPWTKAADGSAAVRIAMTVVEAGSRAGVLATVIAETGLDTDEPVIAFAIREGRINSDLTIGVDVTKAVPLRANDRICSPGVKLHGSGFLVTRQDAKRLGLGRTAGLTEHIRPFRNGRDLAHSPRDLFAIDLFGLESEDVRQRFPAVFQHLVETVKPERDVNRRDVYRLRWWLFGEPRRELRPALATLNRYIVTIETSKHRSFQFLPEDVLADNMLVVIASADAFHLAVLSSRPHLVWALAAGGWLGVGNDPRYSKSRCFDPFPFPEPSPALRAKIASLGEELDALRKAVMEEHPDLTVTGLYNVLEKLRAGAELSDKDEDAKRRGLVLVIKELHEEIDRTTLDAYGWPRSLGDEAILERLVALNAERAREEQSGEVRWLRPEFQAPRFGGEAARRAPRGRRRRRRPRRFRPRRAPSSRATLTSIRSRWKPRWLRRDGRSRPTTSRAPSKAGRRAGATASGRRSRRLRFTAGSRRSPTAASRR
ncbi:class I SAM-dependent DNA methyltransferase [Chenggangzhangella methanolivorans]|uniref:class I SAM-dependent DNA methyltransferase n=1 Tax=Chenggangzhangella methanolivorans TaxID=1437009 RepID=UPI0028F40C03|nr:DNA methyltransferase [Chenggangzhangella methanolivorans]